MVAPLESSVNCQAVMTDITLCQQHRQGKAALEELVKRHGGLARTWARRFSRVEQCCSQEDLFQECQRGLMDAAGHFDPSRGAFTTVACIWMKKRCLAFIEKAKQFGSQSDKLGDVAGNEDGDKDYSHLAKHFHVVERLQKLQAISPADVEILRIVCSPMDLQDEMIKPLFAGWWRQAKRGAISRVAKAMAAAKASGKLRVKARGRGKLPQRLEIQGAIWS